MILAKRVIFILIFILTSSCATNPLTDEDHPVTITLNVLKFLGNKEKKYLKIAPRELLARSGFNPCKKSSIIEITNKDTIGSTGDIKISQGHIDYLLKDYDLKSLIDRYPKESKLDICKKGIGVGSTLNEVYFLLGKEDSRSDMRDSYFGLSTRMIWKNTQYGSHLSITIRKGKIAVFFQQ